MSADNRGGNGRFSSVLLAGTGLGILQAHSAFADDQKTDTSPNRSSVKEVYVLGDKDAYKVDTSSLSTQSIPTVTKPVMQERAVPGEGRTLLVSISATY